MSLDPGHDLDSAIHRQLFGHTDTRMTPRYSTNFTACPFVDVRLSELGWTIVSTERNQSLTTVTLRHANGRQVIGEGLDQYQATCMAAVRMLA